SRSCSAPNARARSPCAATRRPVRPASWRCSPRPWPTADRLMTSSPASTTSSSSRTRATSCPPKPKPAPSRPEGPRSSSTGTTCRCSGPPTSPTYAATLPTTVASYYAASLNEDAPHPAVARLWQEFVFSDEGQNLLLDGYVLPGRLDAMVKADTVDEDSLSKLLDDSVDQEAPQPTQEQRDAQAEVLADKWAEAVG